MEKNFTPCSFALGIAFWLLFFAVRGYEQRFGTWSEVTFIAAFTGPMLVTAIIDRIRRNKKQR